jgi:hypothetical protein
MAQPARTNKGLGRGLSSLMGEAALVEVKPAQNAAANVAAKTGEEGRDILRLPVKQLQPGKYSRDAISMTRR